MDESSTLNGTLLRSLEERRALAAALTGVLGTLALFVIPAMTIAAWRRRAARNAAAAQEHDADADAE